MAEQFPFLRYRDVEIPQLRARFAAAKQRVSVVISVFNGGQVVRSCIQSVLDHSPMAHRIIVIDDAGEDPETRRILDAFRDHGDIELVRHEKNRGYTRTANHGLLLAGTDDVVLLNSDTIVGPMWLQRLAWTAYSQPGIGTVSAVSNDAAANSIPLRHQRNDWYPRLAWSDTARLLGRGMRVWSQEVPSAHGFCMYLRRALIKDLGPLDSKAFPVGYGEEVDYSQRAILAGWKNLVAPHVFVKHLRSQSFGLSRRKKLVEASKVVLWDRYPGMVGDVALWESSVGAALVQQNAARVRSSWLQGEPDVRTVVVQELDLRNTEVLLQEGADTIVPQGDWSFCGNRQIVQSDDELVRAVIEMIVLGCAESVDHRGVSEEHERLLREVALDLAVDYTSSTRQAVATN